MRPIANDLNNAHPHHQRAPRRPIGCQQGDDGSSSRTMARGTNGVVRLRAGFNSTTHEYLSHSCLLCAANVNPT